MAEKKKRKWIKWVIIVAAAIIIGTGIYAVSQASSRAASALLATANDVEVKKGDIAVIVQANGSLKPSASTAVYAPLAAEIGKLSVKNGDTVKKGDLILSLVNNTIDDEITKLQSSITTSDQQILAADKTKSAKIYSPVSGRVKEIYAVPGQETASAMQSKNGLFLISADDKIEIRFAPSSAVAAGDPVTVTIGAKSVESTIKTYSSGEASILLSDDSYEVGASARVSSKDGKALGEGSLFVHMPYYVAGSQGIVSEIKVDVNQMVAASDTLLKLEESVYSSTYIELLTTRQTSLEQLSEKLAQKEQLVVRAPQAGVIEDLSAVQGTSVPEGAKIFSIGSTDTFELIAAVDELDISSIQIGQTANLALDALAGATFTGKVTAISATGTYLNGMTSYDVTILVDQSEKILSGMSARADILVASHTGVPLIPVSAIKTIDGEKYVMVMPAPGTKAGKTPSEGIQTKITVGLFNSSQAEVLSGIQEGQYVKDLAVAKTATGFAAFGGRQNG